MIKIAIPPFKIDISVANDNPLNQPELHIAATALKKFGFCMSYLPKRGMTVTKLAEFCDVVNMKDDVGSLYPSFQFSLFPLNHSGIKETEDEKLMKYVKEILKSHEYFKNAKSLLFVFDAASGYDLNNINERLENILNQLEAKSSINYYCVVY